METTSTFETRTGTQKPRNRVANYFNETKDERRKRQRRERDRRNKRRELIAYQLLTEGDKQGLFELYQFAAEYVARKLQRRLDLGDFMYDDLVQMGYVGVWDAVCTYDPDRGASLTNHVYRCARRRVWAEFDRMKAQQIRGFRYFDATHATHPEPNDIDAEKPPVENELADTEAIAVIIRCLRAVPEDARESLIYNMQGETFSAIGKHQGKTMSGAHVRAKWAIEKLQEMVMPLMMGAWTPFPVLLRDVWADLDELGFNMPEPLPPLTEKVERHCIQCGNAIEGRNGRAKFCKRACKSMWHYLNRK